jgi:hypothetical protein
MSGEPGSFLTTILGAAGPRDLRDEGRLDEACLVGERVSREGDMEEEEAEEAEGGRREVEVVVEGDFEDRLNDVRKR